MNNSEKVQQQQLVFIGSATTATAEHWRGNSLLLSKWEKTVGYWFGRRRRGRQKYPKKYNSDEGRGWRGNSIPQWTFEKARGHFLGCAGRGKKAASKHFTAISIDPIAYCFWKRRGRHTMDGHKTLRAVMAITTSSTSSSSPSSFFLRHHRPSSWAMNESNKKGRTKNLQIGRQKK